MRLDTYGTELFGIWMIEGVHVKPRRRDWTPATSAVCTHVPQLLRIVDISGKSTAHANDGDGHARIHGGHCYVEVFVISPLSAVGNF